MSTMQEKLKKMNPRQLEAVLHTEGPPFNFSGCRQRKDNSFNQSDRLYH